MAKTSNDKDFKLLTKILNGGIAGVVAIGFTYPLDLVKTRLQNQSSTNKKYDSMIDCFRKSLKSSGLKGMYSGSKVNILLITPEKAIKLTANDYFRHKLKDKNGNLALWQEMVSGAGAGLAFVVTTPMELLKIQLQSANKQAIKEMTASKIALQIFKEKGFLAIYKGTLSTLYRDVLFSIIYFPLFANLNKFGPKRKNGESVFWVSFLSGFLAGSVAACSVNPFDVVKTRLQLITKTDSQVNYNGITDAFNKIYKNEGLFAFFKGAGCRVVVIAPLFGIVQTVYYLGVAEYFLSIF